MTAQLWLFGGLIITAIIAPTWLSWWNTRLAKKDSKPNGGKSSRDVLDKISEDITDVKDIIEVHSSLLNRLLPLNEEDDD